MMTLLIACLSVMLMLPVSAVRATQAETPQAPRKPTVFKLLELLRQDGSKRQVFSVNLTLDHDRLKVVPYSRRHKFDPFEVPYATITSATILAGSDSSGVNWGWLSSSSTPNYLTVHSKTGVFVLRMAGEAALVIAEFEARSGVKVIR